MRKEFDVEGFVNAALTEKTPLYIDESDLPATARKLTNILAGSERLFERAERPVVVKPSRTGVPVIQALTVEGVVIEAHRLCQPMKWNGNKNAFCPATLPERVARLYLDMRGEQGLRPLAGVTSAALLRDDGTILALQGYDPQTQLWGAGVREIGTMTSMTSMTEAAEALHYIRETFKTFPFADSPRVFDIGLGVHVVDLDKPPGADESAFLVALIIACCRASLDFGLGLLIRAALLSGAGTGKGKLARAIFTIAFGYEPSAFTMGQDVAELDKRLGAVLFEGAQAVFLDNANGVTITSDLLASVMTESPAWIRILGEMRMVPLSSTAFIAITGNGAMVSGDHARRFLVCELDAKCEDPESRPFAPGYLEGIRADRKNLLKAVLTIWLWGRQHVTTLKRGKPLGGFEKCTEWCRDPLIALGCCDPVERIADVKARDPHRQTVTEFFLAWANTHGSKVMKASELSEDVTRCLNPHNQDRRFVARQLLKLAGTRQAGYVLTQQRGLGTSSTYSYRLDKDPGPQTA